MVDHRVEALLGGILLEYKKDQREKNCKIGGERKKMNSIGHFFKNKVSEVALPLAPFLLVQKMVLTSKFTGSW